MSCGVSASVDAHKAARPSSEHFAGLPCDPPHQTALKPSRSRQLTFSCDTETCSPGLTILRRRRPAPSTRRIVSALLIGGINLDRADNCGAAISKRAPVAAQVREVSRAVIGRLKRAPCRAQRSIIAADKAFRRL